jgi:hypothetical protein
MDGVGMSRFNWISPFLLTSVFLVACGGGGGELSDDSSPVTWSTNPAGAATFSGVSATYQGAITGLGSIVVNGVRFETTDAMVYDGDDFSTRYDNNTAAYNSPLALGMTVALWGDVDDAQSLGRAARIRVVGGVRGTMSAVDISALTLTLPTQTIQLTSATTYGGTTDGTSTGTPITNLMQLVGLSNAPLLTVYGLTQSDGRFLATRVVVTSASAHAMDVAVRGTITAISGNSYTVKTDASSSVMVNCNGCTIQPSVTTPMVGDAVRALAADISQWNGTALTAARLQLVNASYLTSFEGAPSAASYAKIKGAAVLDGSRWRVGGVEVSGVSLTPGALYEIKGTWSGAVLAATRVEVEGQRSFTGDDGSNTAYSNEFYGAVSNLSGSSFTVQGVKVDARSAYFPYGSTAHLTNGAFVEVKGSYVDGILIATKVEIKVASGTNLSAGRVFEMYGQVSDWSGVSSTFKLTRLGVVYNALSSVNTRFEHGVPDNGNFVEAKGYMDANNVFQVIKLEVKNGYSDHDE